MAKRGFIILKYDGRVPSMAGCTGCPCKFFTPEKFGHDKVGAEHYLLEKFDEHKCYEESNASNNLVRKVEFRP